MSTTLFEGLFAPPRESEHDRNRRYGVYPTIKHPAEGAAGERVFQLHSYDEAAAKFHELPLAGHPHYVVWGIDATADELEFFGTFLPPHAR